MIVGTMTGCGAGSLLQSESDRRQEIAAAVAEALDAEKGWQSNFIERRTETMLAEQKATSARAEEVAGRMRELEGRLDELARTVPSIADPGFGRGRPATAARTTTTAPGPDDAEVQALRRDLGAMTGAVAQLLSDREQADAMAQARFERLELRTSQLAWPRSDAERAVHLASYRSHESALRGWEALQDRYRRVLTAETPTFVEVDTVSGRYVRLFVGAGRREAVLDGIRDAVRRGAGTTPWFCPCRWLPAAEPSAFPRRACRAFGPELSAAAIPWPRGTRLSAVARRVSALALGV